MTQARILVADYLFGDLNIAAIASVGPIRLVYPHLTVDENGDDRDITEITKVNTPEAYRENGDIRPVGMVISDTTLPNGPFRGEAGEASAMSIFRIVWWEQYNRSTIEDLNNLTIRRLQGQRVPNLARHYEFQWAGDSPSSLRDESQRNATMIWSRWQVALIRS